MKHLLFLSLLFVALPALGQRSMPFRYENGTIILDAVVADKAPMRFIFDTGGGVAMLDQRILDSCGVALSSDGNILIGGQGGVRYGMHYSDQRLRISAGGHSIYNTPSAFGSYHKVVPHYSTDGLLGIDCVSDSIYRIDYVGHKITFMDARDLETLTGYTRLPITHQGEKRMYIPVDVVVDSQTTVPNLFLIDTGNSGVLNINVPEDTRERYEALFSRRVGYLSGIGGIMGGQRQQARIEAIRLGGFSVTAGYVNLIPRSAGSFNSGLDGRGEVQAKGILGNAVWEQFDVIIDDRNDTLYLRPNANFGKRTIEPNYSGLYLSLNRAGEMVISGLFSCYRGDLRVGDVITHINGESTEQRMKNANRSNNSREGAKSRITIRRDGQTLEIEHTNLNRDTLWQ